METNLSLPVRVNRTPVSTLWAAIVAERVGNPPDIALTLGCFVSDSGARAKARRLCIIDETQEPENRRVGARQLKFRLQMIRLLGSDAPMLAATDGNLRGQDRSDAAGPSTPTMPPGQADSIHRRHAD
jgi:hypothetical protein